MKTILNFIFIIVLAWAAQAQELKLEILNGHSGGGVLAVAVSSDGKFALTGSTDQSALLWDLETGKQLRRFSGYHEDAVSCVQFSKDGRFVLTASYDSSAQLWETATGRRVHGFGENRGGVLVKHSGKILSCAISADMKQVATAGEDETARIWDFESGKQLFELKHAGRVNSIAFSPDSRFLLTGGEDKIARLYSTETGKEEKQFVGHTGEITSVAYSPDGKQVLTGGTDKTLRLWNSNSNVEIKQLKGEYEIFSIAFVSSGNALITTTGDNYLLNLPSGIKVWERLDIVRSVAITPDEKRLVIARGFPVVETAFVIDIESEKVSELVGMSDIVNKTSISSSLQFILTGGNYGTSGLWNLTNGMLSQWEGLRETKQVDSNTYSSPVSINAIDFSPNGKYFVVQDYFAAEDETKLVILDTFNLNRLKKIDFQKEDEFEVEVESVAFSPDGKSILIGLKEGLLLWSVETEKEIEDFKEFNSQVYDAAFSPNGKTIATASDDKTVRLWNAETGEVRQIIKDFSTPVWSVAFSPDGKTLATASGGEIDMSKVGIGDAARANSVRLWDVETGKEIERFTADFKISANKFAGFKSVAYSPDGKYIAAGSFDGKVYLRNNETKELKKFEGHTDTVNSVKFAKDANGKLLVVSGSSDSTTRIWDAATGEEICALVTFRDGNWAVVQTKTGRYDAPNGGEIDGIQWVFGNETIALNQLKDIYYTPSLLPRLLGYNQEPLADVRPLKDIKLFPEIIEQNFDKQTANLTVKLRNRGGGIGAVRVMVNGTLAAEDARSEDLKKQLKTNPNLAEAVVNFNIKSSAGFNPNGENRIEIITNDFDQKTQKSFVSSNPKTSARGTAVFNLGGNEKQIERTFYAIVGGVSDYNGTQLDLNFAAKDSEDFANALNIAARRLFCPKENRQCDRVKIKLLTTNDQANLPIKPNFKAAFKEIAENAKAEDVLVVYLAGHGTSLTVGDAETYFYLTQESDNGSKEALAKYFSERAISNTEILNWLTQEQWRTEKKGIDALNKVLILDTCAAGTFEKALTRDLSADQIRALEKLKDRSGLQILMGSAANQSAYEASQYGQGLLTYALLEGMKGAALKNEREVETGILFDYAVNRVPKMDISGGTIGLQSPRIFGSTSIPIGLIFGKEDRDQIKIQASPLPVFVRPSLIEKGENDDTLDLGIAFAKRLEEAANPNTRDGGGQKTAPLVFVDQRNLSGAYRVTAAYTQAGGTIRLEEIVLKKDDKIIPIDEKISGKDADEVAKLLLTAVLKKL